VSHEASSIPQVHSSGVNCEPERPVTFSVMWCFLLGACELIHLFVCGETNCSNYAEIIRCCRTKFSRKGTRRSGIVHPCSPVMRDCYVAATLCARTCWQWCCCHSRCSGHDAITRSPYRSYFRRGASQESDGGIVVISLYFNWVAARMICVVFLVGLQYL
jgi:hypothetical protein